MKTEKLIPPFDPISAAITVQTAEDSWNTRDADIVVQACQVNCHWRERGGIYQGHQAIRSFLIQKWEQELHYRLTQNLWCFSNHRLSANLEYEWQCANHGQWFRTYGIANWEFANDGLITHCELCVDDMAIAAGDRRIGF